MEGLLSGFENTPKMPVLFLGHGSPMNAIEENEFVRGFRQAAARIPRPSAILCVSAHWETRGTFVTAMPQPRTIHDFGGFPKELYQVKYSAPGSPELAEDVKGLAGNADVGLDQLWGLDHGAWTVLRHLYPNADVPVIQLSLDYTRPPLYHYELARQLAALREKGVLIIGSGNIVHNLRLVAWNRMNEVDFAFDWAAEADSRFKGLMADRNHQALCDYQSLGREVGLAVPTPEHFLPLLYVLALQGANEELSYFNDRAVAGSLTMTSVIVGR